MRAKLSYIVIAGLLLTSGVLAQPTATVSLSSSQGGSYVAPGATIDWTIEVSVSAGDNDGLALVCANLVQNSGNPAFIDLPPADDVPAGMAKFSRPAGISNPGEGGATTGYIGVQRGDTGAMNLIQIGGGQNTFGQAGGIVGTDPDCIPGVGQGSPQLVASGSFVAPTTRGHYELQLEDVLANVILEHNTPPDHSPVGSATVALSPGTIGFNITCTSDINGTGMVDLADLQVLLSNYGAMSGAAWADGDLDGDGDVDLSDLQALLSEYGTSC